MNSITKKKISMFDLLACLTNAGDLVSPKLAEHHQKVAYLAYKIASQLDLTSQEQKELMLAGLLHDVGALSLRERLELIESEPISAQDHASKGAKLLEHFSPLTGAAGILRFHHVPWNHGAGMRERGQDVPFSSHILHLADRIAVLIDADRDVIGQIEPIEQIILSQRDTKFNPAAVDAFLSISKQEYIWLDVVYKPLLHLLPRIVAFDVVELELDGLISIAQMIACIIDFRSPFTANHSVGVAKTAEKLAQLAGFSEDEQKMMLVAGYLHDLGKLAVKNDILEKNNKLNEEEFNVIRSHTFYTFRLLQAVDGFELINVWASFHHEKLNGEGYPFHLTAESIPLGSRIMAIADVFTAVTEDRPYRKGMDVVKAVAVLDRMVVDGSLCPYVVSLLKSNLEEVNEMRRQAQISATLEYRNFISDSKQVDKDVAGH